MDVHGSCAGGWQVAVAPLRAGLVAATAVAAMAVGGCAGLQQPEVEQVAATFTQSGPVDRCALLAPATVAALEHDESAPCADALGALDLPGGQVMSSAVWGDDAQVRLTGDTLFLTRTGHGLEGGGRRLHTAGRGPVPVPAGGLMRSVRVLFVAYLSLIGLGLVYFALLGLLGR